MHEVMQLHTTRGRTIDTALLQRVHIFLAFVDICLTFVRHADQLVTLRYRDSSLELDITKRMVHGIAKQASKKCTSDDLLVFAVFSVESKLAEWIKMGIR